MKILIITQWFNPEPNDMKALVFAKKLKEMGNKVQVITGFPNYPTGIVYDGYKLQKYRYEEMDGIPIHRVWLFPSHNSNKWKRMLNYLSFGFSARYFGKHKLQYDFDVVYVYHPPITSAEAAIAIARKHGKKILVDINDLWPESILATKMMSNSIPLRIIDTWCRRVYKRVDKINVLSKRIKNALIDKGVPPEKIAVIPVWCNETLLTNEIDEEFYNANKITEKFTLIYAGAIGKAQNLSVFVDVAKELQGYSNIQIILIGTGTEADNIRHSIKENNLENIKMMPNVPPNRVVSILNCADVLLIHLASDELFKSTIPSKIPLYMATKKPIIAGLEGEAADLILNAGSGIVCKPESIDELVKAVLDMYTMSPEQRAKIGEKGFSYYKKIMSIDYCVKQFVSELEKLKLDSKV